MPQTNPNAGNEEKRWRRSLEARLKHLEITVPTAKDSIYVAAAGTTFNTSSSTFVTDSGLTVLGPLNCFGTPSNDVGTNVLVSGSCVVGLDTTTVAIGGEIGVQVDGGATVEPGDGPGVYFLAIAQANLGGLQVSASGSRVIQVLSPANTQGLSRHSFAMVFRSTQGQTIHFENRLLAIDPQ
jgi:hypothetical protein